MGGKLARGCCLMQTPEQIVSDVAAPALPRRAYPGVRPGGGPLWNLAHALAELEGGTPSAARVNELRLSFDRTGADLTQIVTHLAGMEQERLCLLVDQFEELFRYARETSREESRLFVDLITTVLKQDSASPVRVILTMRSEFLGECARLPG